MSNVDLKSKIAAAKLALNTTLLEGGDTSKHRARLRELEAEQAAIDQQQTSKQVAREALKQIVADRIADSAAALAEARANRLAVLASQFAISTI